MKLRRMFVAVALVCLCGLVVGGASGYAFHRWVGTARRGSPPAGDGSTRQPGGGDSRGDGGADDAGGTGGAGGAGGAGSAGVAPDQGDLGPPVPIIDHLPGRPPRAGAPDPTTGPQIALTFDAGWIYDTTPDLLRVLDEKSVKATFFLRARWVEEHPDLARDIVSRGHLVEDHSYSHQDFTKLDRAARGAELDRAQTAFAQILGFKPDLFRPPYGAYDQELLSELGARGYRAAVMWSTDSLDWSEPGAEQVSAKVLAGARDGGIILMHVGSRDGVAALPTIIDGLRARGYRLVRLDELS